MWTDEFAHANQRKLTEDFYEALIDGRQPSIRRPRDVIVDEQLLHYEIMLLPLSEDGSRISMIMTGIGPGLNPPADRGEGRGMAEPKKPRKSKTINRLRRMSGATEGPLRERRDPPPEAARSGRRRRQRRRADQLAGVLQDLLAHRRPLWSSEQKTKVRLLTLVLVGLTICQVGVPVAINRWMRWLFDALEQKAMHQFAELSWILLLILVSNVAIVNLHLRVKRRLQIGWRAWLSQRRSSTIG